MAKYKVTKRVGDLLPGQIVDDSSRYVRRKVREGDGNLIKVDDKGKPVEVEKDEDGSKVKIKDKGAAPENKAVKAAPENKGEGKQ